MNIQKIHKIASKKMSPGTNSELNIGAYKMHYYFWRFLFAAISFLLYIPTLWELYQNINDISDHIRNIIILIILLAIEIGLSFSLSSYFIKKYNPNPQITVSPKRWIYILLAIISILLSSFSGLNAVKISSGYEMIKIKISEKNEKMDQIGQIKNQLAKNNSQISKNDQLAKNNNELIKSLKKVSVTGHGAGQIKKYQEQNLILQEQNNDLIEHNKTLLEQLNKLEEKTERNIEKKWINYSKKELIYMIIFFLSGFFTVLGLIYSYRFIAKYYRDLILDTNNIKQIQNLLLATSGQYKTNEPLNIYDKKIKNEISIAEKLNITGFDLAKIQKTGIDIKKAYIFIELQNKFGYPFDIEKIKQYGINNISRQITVKYPEGYKISQVKMIIKQIIEFYNGQKVAKN